MDLKSSSPIVQLTPKPDLPIMISHLSRDQKVPSVRKESSESSEPTVAVQSQVQQTSTSPSSTSGSERAKTSSVDGSLPVPNLPTSHSLPVPLLPSQSLSPAGALPGLLPPVPKDVSVETLLYLRQLVQPSLNQSQIGLGLHSMGLNNVIGLANPLLNPSFNVFNPHLPTVNAFQPSNLYSLYSDATALYLKSRETIAQIAARQSFQK